MKKDIKFFLSLTREEKTDILADLAILFILITSVAGLSFSLLS